MPRAPRVPRPSHSNSQPIADLVPKIKQAWDILLKAQEDGFRSDLRLAIALGELLNQAKDEFGTHGQWTPWLNAQQFEFSNRTAQRCMKFARKKDALLRAANSPRVAELAREDLLTVRGADMLLRKAKTKRAKSQSPKPPKPKPWIKSPEPEPSSDPEAVLAALAADEMAAIIGRWDKEKRDRLLAQLVEVLGADELDHILKNRAAQREGA
jgi:hypothetical protein